MSEQQRTSTQVGRGVPPYRPGERIHAVDPVAGTGYLLRVERIAPVADGFKLVAAVRWPRRLRSHVVTITVDADGRAPELGLEPDRRGD